MLNALALADKADDIKAARRVVSLRATWETRDALADWAKAQGFDLAWSYSGWPQGSWAFDFHVTVIATKNKVKIPDGVRNIDTVTLVPTGFDAFGDDGKTAVIRLEDNETLAGIRSFFMLAYGAKPTFDEFKPHMTVSYRWNGAPALATIPLPAIPLKFDYLQIGTLDTEPEDQLLSAIAADAKPGEGLRHILKCQDAITLGKRRRTADGFLQVEARVARTGIQDYMGYEVGDTDNPGKVWKVYRPEDEIFKAKSLATFAHKPVTMGHPINGVDAKNWRKEAIGSVGSEVLRDGTFVVVPMLICDQGAIDEIEAGTQEISMGYDCDLIKEAGTTPDGLAYDAYQANVRINHAAVVPMGRAGHECRIGDAQSIPQQKDDQTMTTKKIIVDGAAHDVPTAVADRLTSLEATAKAFADASANAKLIADKWEAQEVVHADTVKTLNGEITALKAQVLSDADKDLAVAERVKVIADARTLAPDVVTDGKSLADIRAAAVREKTGQKFEGKDAVKDAAFFDGAFSGLLGQTAVADTADIVAFKAGVGVKDEEPKTMTQVLTDRYALSMKR